MRQRDGGRSRGHVEDGGIVRRRVAVGAPVFRFGPVAVDGADEAGLLVVAGVVPGGFGAVERGVGVQPSRAPWC